MINSSTNLITKRKTATLTFFLLLFTCYFLLLLPHHQRIINLHLYSAYSSHQAANLVLEPTPRVDAHSCTGRRVYVYELPSHLNLGLAEKCNNLLVGWIDFCRHLKNHGLGEAIQNTTAWYRTDAYMLEVIFHSRILRYSCRTNDSTGADAFFIPYYAGVDALRYLYRGNIRNQEIFHGKELVNWLVSEAGEEWKRWNGKDHFMVMGRTSWDFAAMPGWGTGIQELDHVKNLTTLYIERNPWQVNEFAVPYPTSFHPSSDSELRGWLERVRSSKRTYLFAISGGLRPSMPGTRRGVLFKQCEVAESCIHVDCGGRLKCGHNPRPSVDVFLRSTFCLQPRGDTPTRRSTFDSLISGCIPVFFHNDSAYTQYLWHLPSDPATYSVYIPEDSILEGGGVQVEKLLRSYSGERVDAMRDRIVSLIPRLIYRLPGKTDEPSRFEDAFDVTLRRVLERVADLKHL